jgi:hypothetical protein
MADESVVEELLKLAKEKRHGEVKAKLSKADKPTQRAFKEVCVFMFYNFCFEMNSSNRERWALFFFFFFLVFFVEMCFDTVFSIFTITLYVFRES